MLVRGETYAQRKAFILDFIRVDRELIAEVRKVQKKSPDLDDLCREVIANNQAHIKDLLAELASLSRWWEKEGKAHAKERLSKTKH